MKRALLALCWLGSAAHADELADRKTVIAGFGLVWMQIERVVNSGMAVQPTFTRTFDRFELQGEYLLADLRDESEMQPGSLLHRIGVTGRYQVGRVRPVRDLTLDFVVEAGVGLQYISRDTGDAFGRNDFAIGVGGRLLADVVNKRTFMGMEMMARMLVTPSADKAFVFVFGIPFGR